MIVIRDPKTFYFGFYWTLDWSLDVDENLKHGNELIIKRNTSLAGNKIKNETEQGLKKHTSIKKILMNTENSKTNESHKIVINLPQRLDFQILED